MLLRNESMVEHFVHLKLVFDDNTEKEFNIFVGECVRIKYIKDGCCKMAEGIIKHIMPYNTRRTVCKYRKESAIITVDSSYDFNGSIDEFDTKDIVDIEKIDYCYGCHGCCKQEESPEETPVDPPVEEEPNEEESNG